MPGWTCAAGSTLLIPSGAQGNHLFIVLNNPANFVGYPPQSCVSVCICSIRKGPYDETCLVAVGEHPFVVQPSYVSYRHGRIDPCAHLKNLVDEQTIFPNTDVSAGLLGRIQAGLKASPQTPNYLKQLQSA